jgi:hypothetical protein
LEDEVLGQNFELEKKRLSDNKHGFILLAINTPQLGYSTQAAG